LKLPQGAYIEKAIKAGRKRQKAFPEIRGRLKELVTSCAKGSIGGHEFYEGMKEVWWRHESRFQGDGFQIKGKHGNWADLSSGLLTVLVKSHTCGLAQLDQVVRIELDRLADSANPCRGSWLSEMLCHFFPDRYPLLNKPVREWLKYNRYRAPRGASEGSKYIDLALKLRAALRTNTANGAKNLADLDHALWAWWDRRKRRRSQE
jgi:hypothetical protein